MRAYELVFIVSPELEEEAIKEIADRVSGWITDEGGKINQVEDWGRRKFSYLIGNHKEGQYYLFQVEMDPSLVATLERNLRLQEPILRYLITVQEE
ncbi:MAG: 30S ribosomal protein S6 [Anaerolineales bacterium]|nr:30S ribosomal protein S6 [Anaerolineales bacterium]